jgi:uncharacterized protein YprB with RNaseH-like and TPR domain
MRSERSRDLSKMLFLDIETVPLHYAWGDMPESERGLYSDKTRFERERTGMTEEELHRSKGGILSEFGKIICIGLGFMHQNEGKWHLRVTSYQGDHEYDLLRRLVELLDRDFNTERHSLCGHNGKEFDFPWIARRCLVHGLRLPLQLDMAGKKPWEVTHADTMELWKFGDRKNFTSLALLTHVLGIPTPKDDISGKDIARVYYEEDGLERIAAYCRKDVVATAQVYLRLTGRELVPAERIDLVP